MSDSLQKVERHLSALLLSFGRDPIFAEQNHAHIMRELAARSMSPSDLQVSDRRSGALGHAQRLMAKDRAKIETLQRENRYLRSQVDVKALRSAAKAGQIDFQWLDLEDQIRERLGGDLPHGWRERLAAHLDVRTIEVRQWEQGVAPIPPEVWPRLKTLPGWVSPASLGPAERKKRASNLRRPGQPPESEGAQATLAVVRSAGRDGMTHKDVTAAGGDHRRLSDLEKHLLVFANGRRDGSKVYVHRDFSDQFPMAWAQAQTVFDRPAKRPSRATGAPEARNAGPEASGSP